MSVDNNPNIPDVLSISQMAKLLNLSRSRVYQLASEGVFLPPIYSADTKRPYYTADMARRNLEAKINNKGINGKICLFYTSRNSSVPHVHKKKTPGNKKNNISPEDKFQDIREGLSALGLEGVSDAQIESALKQSFPEGEKDVPEGEILRAIFLQIKRRNSEHNL